MTKLAQQQWKQSKHTHRSTHCAGSGGGGTYGTLLRRLEAREICLDAFCLHIKYALHTFRGDNEGIFTRLTTQPPLGRHGKRTRWKGHQISLSLYLKHPKASTSLLRVSPINCEARHQIVNIFSHWAHLSIVPLGVHLHVNVYIYISGLKCIYIDETFHVLNFTLNYKRKTTKQKKNHSAVQLDALRFTLKHILYVTI